MRIMPQIIVGAPSRLSKMASYDGDTAALFDSNLSDGYGFSAISSFVFTMVAFVLDLRPSDCSFFL